MNQAFHSVIGASVLEHRDIFLTAANRLGTTIQYDELLEALSGLEITLNRGEAN
jgi:hypothetical protein